jgi:arylsulfatase A-like enzyme
MKKPNVIVICIDALRKDHMPKMQFLSKLGNEGISFERHTSTNDYTLPAVATILTGLLASDHGVHRYNSELDDKIPTLSPLGITTFPEVFESVGYNTAAVVPGGWTSSQFGFSRGFKEYHEVAGQVKAKEVLKELTKSQHPFLLYVHLLEVHDWFKETQISIQEWKKKAFDRTLTREDQIAALSAYGSMCSLVDDFLYDFVELLYELIPEKKETFIAVTSDHGEGFGEGHPTHFHHDVICPRTRQLTHVPFVIWSTNRKTFRSDSGLGFKVFSRTWDYDFAPTMLQLLTTAVSFRCEGVNLFASLSAELHLRQANIYKHIPRMGLTEDLGDGYCYEEIDETGVIEKQLQGLGYKE